MNESDTICVGDIEGHPVIYVPYRDIVFCKNTSVKVCRIEAALSSSNDKDEIPEKNLTIYKSHIFVTFGCLTTTKTNVRAMLGKINKIKPKNKKQ